MKKPKHRPAEPPFAPTPGSLLWVVAMLLQAMKEQGLDFRWTLTCTEMDRRRPDMLAGATIYGVAHKDNRRAMMMMMHIAGVPTSMTLLSENSAEFFWEFGPNPPRRGVLRQSSGEMAEWF